jgi:hypothetical protein
LAKEFSGGGLVSMELSLMDFDDGAARFAGSIRGGDEAGHYVFELRLRSLPILYGEWRPKWEPNGDAFNVEILRFGYLHVENASNPHPRARQQFSEEQRNAVQRLVIALFSSAEAREGVFPFTIQKGRCLGGVQFSPGWILLNSVAQ